MKPSPRAKNKTEALAVYEKLIGVLLFFKPIEELDEIVHPDFHGYGTAAHEYFFNIDGVRGMAEMQAEQLAGTNHTLTRNLVYQNFASDGKTCLILEEFVLHMQENDHTLEFRVSTLLEEISGKWIITHFHGSTPDSDIAEEEAFPMEGLRKKNQELEAKIRERTRDLEIEAALERIRTVSMAMQKTEDVASVVEVFFEQLKSLELHFVQAWINVFHMEEGYFDIWFSPLEGIYKEVRHFQMPTALFEDTSIKSWKEGRKFSYLSITSKEEMDALVQACDTATQSNYFTHFQEILQIDKLEFLDANYKYGSISKSGYVKATKEEEDILHRFAKAFEQTYTRFLDLQKAEAQAREAQIETALERVRARSMAMQSSEELSDVLSVLFQQFDHLGIAPKTAWLTLWNPDDHTFIYRSTGTSGKRIQGQQVLDIDGMEIWKDLYEKWKTDTSDAVEVLFYRKEDLGQLFQLMKETFLSMPEKERLTAEHFPEGGYSVQGHCKFGYIGYTHTKHPTEEESEILVRFAREFGRVYQRFLDIEKAEAQARESQIQLSLERIRARTMAMQTTDELTDVLSQLFKQFDILGIDPAFAHLTLFNEDNDTFSFRITGTSGQRVIAEQIIDMASYPVWYESYEKWKNGDPGIVDCIDYPPEVIPGVFEIMQPIFSKLPPDSEIKAEDFPQGIYTTQGHCQFGYIGFNHSRRATEEEKEIVRKFALEFGGLYQRFLDLKKAENQAREAQIEAALERVRARTMAMHNTEDIAATVTTFFNELMGLHPDSSIRCGIGILSQSEHMELWTASVKDGSEAVLHAGTLDMSLHPLLEGVKETWKKKEETFSYELKGKEVKKYFQILNKAPDYPVNFDLDALPKSVYHNSFVFKDGTLFVFTEAPLKDEIRSVVVRFAAVFGQTYTRYLDLQKAEAQARESQIQLSLERVRARSLAMQSSDELHEVLGVLFRQFDDLGIQPVNVFLSLFDRENRTLTYRASGKSGKRMPGKQVVEVDSMDALRALYDKWLADNSDAVEMIFYPREVLPQLFGIFSETFSSMPKADRMGPEDFPEGGYSMAGYTPFGYLGYDHQRMATEEEQEILSRFCTEFTRVYQRFLDLQKVEAQAREARIEAALEKVRSQSLAMHTTDEMQQVANVVYEQLRNLGVEMDAVGMSGVIEEKQDYDVWVGGAQMGEVLRIPYNEETEVQRDYNKAIKERDELFAKTYSGKVKEEYIQNLLSHGDFPKDLKDKMISSSAFSTSIAFSRYSGIQIARYTAEPYSEEVNDLLKRFARVFEQAYIRFRDLERAEAQAREAEIQLALERIRARAMAMQESSELTEVLSVIFQQLKLLGVETIWTHLTLVHLEENAFTYRMTGRNGERILAEEKISLDASEHWKHISDAVKSQDKDPDPITRFEVPVEGLDAIWELFDGIFSKLPDGQKVSPSDFPNGLFTTQAYCKFGFLGLNFTREATEEEADILLRFTTEFSSLYQRFLDLQNAEYRARESQVEAALERIRSHVTGMQESSELLDIVVTMRTEFIRLGHEAHYFWHMRWLPEIYQKAMTSGDGTRIGMVMQLPRHIHGDIPLLAKWEKGKEPTVVYSMDADTAVAYVDKMISLGDFQQVDPQAPSADDIRQIGGLTFVMARTTHGEIGYSLPGVVLNPPAEDMNTLVRFAGVFDLAYRRFEDLKESERQKREAEIELALERVRARTMAMQHSDELAEASHLLDKEVRALGIRTWGCAFNIYRQSDSIEWFGNEAGLLPTYTVPRKGIFKQYYEMGQQGESLFVKEIAGEECVAHYEYMSTLPVVGDVLRQLKETNGAFPTYQIDHVVYFKYGYLLFITREAVPEAHDIFKRFASVFEQTYTRFLDLQKAEAQAKEAVKQASIDRIRGQIASMRSASDLERITPLIWNELTTLGIPFIRCGVFIVEESDNTVQAFLSSPDGRSLGAMRIPVDADKDTAATVAHWKKAEVYRTHWNKEQFLEFMQTMKGLGQVRSEKEYQGAEEPPESLFLHFLPFKQGMLYVGNTESLNQEQMEAVGSLADAFAIAYARYEDFVKLEKAKKQVETALSELKETQNQLVHSEKMASLGELTAGIAHEIQNPLNFVNNFSEVSEELLEEMEEEMKKGDLEEVRLIMEDIKQNLNKINHHGKRADGIVKGMLQHSRVSSGEKELTDINILADEYLRLAYHGLRAKDKSFNATLETHFDESLGKVEIVPQDIGRVILNLITNAFHVVKEKKEKAGAGYIPTVTVSTHKCDTGVEIVVQDNGNGIPEGIRDKIFQPFFTTKPTGQGTGLGLSMSYDIVTKGHGGVLKVNTKEGEGTQFNVFLPMKKD